MKASMAIERPTLQASLALLYFSATFYRILPYLALDYLSLKLHLPFMHPLKQTFKVAFTADDVGVSLSKAENTQSAVHS